MTTANVRFWVFWNGSFAKLTVTPDKPVTLKAGGPTDEGWTLTVERYTLDDDGALRLEWLDDGQDCDGRLTRGGEFYCPRDQLTAHIPEDRPADVEGIPQWQRYNRDWQRDEYAEAAGY